MENQELGKKLTQKLLIKINFDLYQKLHTEALEIGLFFKCDDNFQNIYQELLYEFNREMQQILN